MKSTGKIILAAFLSFIVIAWTVPSEAWRGHGGRRGHAGHYRHGGHYRHKGHYGYKRHHGRKHRIKHGRRHHGHKRYVRRSHHGHRYGVYLGYGYRSRSYYSHYGYGHKSYYSYPHRYRYHYNSYGKSRYYDKGYPDHYKENPYQSGIENAETGYAHGWDLLRRDRASEALETFSRLAQANPSKGTPKVGYAIASAELGHLDKGIRAMRRALQSDPDALHYLTIDEGLRPKVERLADRYERSQRFSGRDPGGSFMLAALYYLLDDMDAAQEAIERNRNSYDTSTSAENLKRLIEDETQDKL